MNSLENAKVGDNLFVSNGVVEYLETVERLTQTLVITKSHRFAKTDGKLYGSEYWNVLYARLATDDDIAKAERKNVISRCRKINFEVLSDTQLAQILEIANNHVKLD